MIEDQQTDGKFNSQTMELASTLNCKANTDIDSRSNNVGVINSNSNMPIYYRSSTKREADKKQAN